MAVHQQEPTFRLGEILHAKLNERLVGDGYPFCQLLNNVIFAPSRKHLEFTVANGLCILRSVVLYQNFRLRHAQRLEIAQQLRRQ